MSLIPSKKLDFIVSELVPKIQKRLLITFDKWQINGPIEPKVKRFTKQNKERTSDYILGSGIMHLANNIMVVSFFVFLSFCDLIDLINCPQGNNK